MLQVSEGISVYNAAACCEVVDIASRLLNSGSKCRQVVSCNQRPLYPQKHGPIFAFDSGSRYPEPVFEAEEEKKSLLSGIEHLFPDNTLRTRVLKCDLKRL